MHLSAYEKMSAILDGYFGEHRSDKLRIIDMGSMVAETTQFSIKPLTEGTAWEYVGVDIETGKNVDIVLKDPYVWSEIEDNSVDAVLCSQVFEHVEFPWVTIKEIERVLKPRGVAVIIAPAAGLEHRFPYDCWRIYPDGWRALCKEAKLNTVEVYTQWKPLYYTDGSDKWQDSCVIAQKADGEHASSLPKLSDKQVLEAYANSRRKTHGGLNLKCRRRLISKHLRGLLKALFLPLRSS